MSRITLSEYVNPSLAHQSVFMEDASDAMGNKAKQLHMAGIFIQGDVRNANQRIYPVHEIKKAVATLQEQIIATNGVTGECDHPSDLKINLDRVSHVITEMKMDGPNGYGKLKIIPTPMGNIIKSMLEAGVKLGVSSRGSGNVNEANGHVSDFEIITVDIVAQPSAPMAWPVPMYESLLNMKHGHKLLDVSKDAMQDKRVQKYLTEGIIKLIKELKL